MLCKLMSEDNNWQMYRDDLDGCLSSTAPCIPYLGQFLTQVCHQLSYNKMRAEKEEVRIRRRSKSFIGITDNHLHREKELVQLRRRSNSFHRNSLELCGDRRSSATSMSTPVSPVVSDDESDSLGEREKKCIEQTGSPDQDDSQSLELSLSFDDRALDLPMSQPEAVEQDPLEGCTDLMKTPTRRRSSQRSMANFQSTPVRDANGYIRPLCAPFPREINFDEPSMNQGYDEPDSVETFVIDVGKESISQKDKELTKSSDEEESSLIPSISLQKNSSHSSLEEWDEDRMPAAKDQRKISKSQSLESSLGIVGLMNVKDSDVDGTRSLNRLTLSHSTPSLDSDSVFSIEDEREREEGGRGGEGEDEKGRGIHQQPEDVLPLDISVGSQFSVEESQNEESLCTHSLPATIIGSFSLHKRTGVGGGKEMMFSPVSSPPDNHRHYKHNRDHPTSAVDSSSNHDNRDNSISPVDVDQHGRNEGQSSSSTADNSHSDDLTRTRQSVKRSNSFSSTTYRHKWRWKKAVALVSASTNDKPLNNADPFNLLHIYQKRSRDCCPPNSTCRVDFRTFLSKLNNNSETKNYELSFEREP